MDLFRPFLRRYHCDHLSRNFSPFLSFYLLRSCSSPLESAISNFLPTRRPSHLGISPVESRPDSLRSSDN